MDETLEQFARRLHCAHTNTDDIIEMLWEARRDSRTVEQIREAFDAFIRFAPYTSDGQVKRRHICAWLGKRLGIDLNEVSGPPLRRFCWRIGGCVTLPDGAKCPECGDLHAPLRDQSRCARVVSYGDGGNYCTRAAGHEGKCRYEVSDE